MDPILINGVNYSWANLQLVLFGVPITQITKISYDRSREAVNNYGAGNEPVSMGFKNFTYKGSLTVYVDTINQILITAPNRSILEIPPVDAVLIFSGDGINYTTHTIRNIRFTSDPFSAGQADSMLTVDLPFIFAGLKK